MNIIRQNEKLQKRVDNMARQIANLKRENEKVREERDSLMFLWEQVCERLDSFNEDYAQLLADIAEVEETKRAYQDATRDVLKMKKEYESKMRGFFGSIKQ